MLCHNRLRLAASQLCSQHHRSQLAPPPSLPQCRKRSAACSTSPTVRQAECCPGLFCARGTLWQRLYYKAGVCTQASRPKGGGGGVGPGQERRCLRGVTQLVAGALTRHAWLRTRCCSASPGASRARSTLSAAAAQNARSATRTAWAGPASAARPEHGPRTKRGMVQHAQEQAARMHRACWQATQPPAVLQSPKLN